VNTQIHGLSIRQVGATIAIRRRHWIAAIPNSTVIFEATYAPIDSPTIRSRR
jgi:hypothetical protein